MINNEAKILADKAINLIQQYNIKKESAQQLCTTEIQKIKKDNEGTHVDLEELQKSFNELNNQVQAKEKKKQYYNERIKSLEDARTELLVKQKRADSSSRFGKSYREAINKIKVEENYIQAQQKDLNVYKKISDAFKQDIQKLKSNANDNLKLIIDQEEKNNSELQTKLDEKHL